MTMGYIHIYTGNGKGKTTCALGLALRAYGAGQRIYIGQFIKEGTYSEIQAIKMNLPQITVEQYGKGFVKRKLTTEAHRQAAQEGFKRAHHILFSGDYDMVLLDEIIIAVHLELLTQEQLLQLMNNKPKAVELVLTGRYATTAMLEKADLVTEMSEIKHYYKQGVLARVGIEE